MQKRQAWTLAHFRIWAAWQAQTRETTTSRIPRIIDYGSALWARCSAAYKYVQALPRGVRRALQHTLAPSLAQIALLLVLGTGAAQAATIMVANTPPTINDDGQCSLVEAIINANADAATHDDCDAGSGPDTIVLPPNSTHTLGAFYDTTYRNTGLPLIVSTITIQGNSSTIKRDSTNPKLFRIIAVNGSGNLTLQGMTVSGGVASILLNGSGGGILNRQGRVVLEDSTVSGNSGEGISNYAFDAGASAELSASNSTITGNSGGGIRNRAFGSGASAVLILASSTVSGNSHGGISNHAYAGASAVLSVIDSTITGNSSGGITNFASGSGASTELSVSNSTITGNSAAASGGGIYNFAYHGASAVLSVSNSTITGNSAGNGGGVISYARAGAATRADLELVNSTVSGNSAAFDGGGVLNQAADFRDDNPYDYPLQSKLTLINTTVSGNTAGQDGGGIVNVAYGEGTSRNQFPAFAVLSMANSTVSDNSAGDDGGGVANDANYFGQSHATLTDSIISGNTAEGDGGGVANDAYGRSAYGTFNLTRSYLTLTNSTVSDNTAGNDGGGAASVAGGGSGKSVLALTNSTISGNSATQKGGGLISYVSPLPFNPTNFFRGELTLTNSTISGNTAGQEGGGVFNTAYPASGRNCTISANWAGTQGGGVFNDGILTLESTLVSGNTAVDGAEIAGPSRFTRGGFSLFGHSEVSEAEAFVGFLPGANDINATTGCTTPICTPTALSDILAPLALNAPGTTQTHALVVSSPAIDAGDNSDCPETDQRGVTRADGLCDIGAFELEDRDGDGFTLEEGDCNDVNPAVHPGATEVCNGVDDNCSGAVDEPFNVGTACSVGVGACQSNGTFQCTVGGQGTECNATPGTPSTEVCNGVDDDCDGVVDDSTSDIGQSCETGQPGVCSAGTTVCTDGALSCHQSTSPATELCADGVDNDCDALVDSADADCALTDLAVTKTAPATLKIQIGGQATLIYTIGVKNSGPGVANGVVMTDPLPSGTTFVSATTSQGSCSTPAVGAGGTVQCAVGPLSKGANALLKVVVKVRQSLVTLKTITNKATVSANTPDPNSANNAATTKTTVVGVLTQ